MRPFVIAILLTALSACGPLHKGSSARAALDVAMNTLRPGAQTEQPLVTQELANADEILFVTIRRQGAVLPMTKSQTNGAVETWVAANGATVSLENDILVASRGLGFDLSGADPTGVAEAISAGGGTIQRRHGYLNPLDQIAIADMTCTISRIGVEEIELPRGPERLTKFEEECAGNRLVFKNEYWTNDSNQIVRSLQVLSQEIGFLLFEKA